MKQAASRKLDLPLISALEAKRHRAAKGVVFVYPVYPWNDGRSHFFTEKCCFFSFRCPQYVSNQRQWNIRPLPCWTIRARLVTPIGGNSNVGEPMRSHHPSELVLTHTRTADDHLNIATWCLLYSDSCYTYSAEAT